MDETTQKDVKLKPHLHVEKKELHQVWTTESADSDSCALWSRVTDCSQTCKSTSEGVYVYVSERNTDEVHQYWEILTSTETELRD